MFLYGDLLPYLVAESLKWTLLGPLQNLIIYKDPHARYDNDSSELMIFYASLLYMTWNHNDAIRCLALEPSPRHTVIIIYLVFVNDGCLGSKSLISGWQCSICGTNCSVACWCQLWAFFFFLRKKIRGRFKSQ